MGKQKMILPVFISALVLAAGTFAGKALANGNATVSWVAPTTDEGGGALTGLNGYRVYYSTAAISCTNLPSTFRDVPGGTVLRYTFNGTAYLTPGSTYNFAVVAYDDSGNLSGCATGSGGVTTVSKLVSYAGDLNNDHSVNILDYNILKAYFGTSNVAGDVNRDGTVSIFDYNTLKADFSRSF